MKNACQRCLMPFNQDPRVREDDRYCSYCFQNGDLVGKELNLAEFKSMSYQQMRQHGMGTLKAKFFTYMIGFAPYWQNKQNTNV